MSIETGKTLNRAIFFDRDGVVNFRIVKQYIKSSEEFHFLEDFIDFFTFIKRSGYLAILVTNQQGIGKGLMTGQELGLVHDYMQSQLRERTGYAFEDIIYCPDLAATGSWRRKPNPGMLIEGIGKWNVDIAQSWMIGDRRSDVQAGAAANLRTILIGQYTKEDVPAADYIFMNMRQAMKLFE